MSRSVEEKRRDRAAFMNALYDASDGSERFWTSYRDIAHEVGLSEEDASKIVEYLVGEGLVEWVAMGGTIGITHYGVVEVEASRTEPDTPTEHFPPFNVIVGNISNSQIQQGTTSSVQALTSSSATLEAVETVVSIFHDRLEELELDEQERRAAEAELLTLEAQLASPTPNEGVLRASLGALREIALSVGGSVAAQAIMHQFGILGM